MNQTQEWLNQERLKCNRKRSYRRRADARRAQRRSQTIHGGPFRIYKCPWCDNYHLTTRQAKSGDLSASEFYDLYSQLND